MDYRCWRRAKVAKKISGQSTAEFTFAMIAILFLLYGVIQVFRWVGLDMAQRQYAHEQSRELYTDPKQQLSPSFYRPARLNAFGPTDVIKKEQTP